MVVRTAVPHPFGIIAHLMPNGLGISPRSVRAGQMLRRHNQMFDLCLLR